MGSDATLQRIVAKPHLSDLGTAHHLPCAQIAQMRLGYDALKQGVVPQMSASHAGRPTIHQHS